MFVVYLAFYLGFVLINAFRPAWMEWVALAGLNLAIVYGFGLIVAALLLALVYGFACRTVPLQELERPHEEAEHEEAEADDRGTGA